MQRRSETTQVFIQFLQVTRILLCLGLTIAWIIPTANAQFNSGSDGSDGALTFAANAGTIVFDPATFTPPLDGDGDNVFNFTTITIPPGTTVHLSADILGEGRPVIWLTSGAVQIDGTLDLNGEDGHAHNVPVKPSIAGAGGYGGGGIGATVGSPPQAGNGPGGGGPPPQPR